MFEEAGAADEGVGATAGAFGGGFVGDAAVDFDVEVEAAASAPGGGLLDFWECFVDEGLAAEAWIDRHDEEEVDAVEERFDFVDDGGWVDGEADGFFEFANFPDEVVDFGGAEFDVDGHAVGAGFGERFEKNFRARAHEVDVEGNFGLVADDFDDLGAEGNVGDEMAVHDVEVNPVGLGFFDATRFGGEFAEVSSEQRGRNNHGREARVFRFGVKHRSAKERKFESRHLDFYESGLVNVLTAGDESVTGRIMLRAVFLSMAMAFSAMAESPILIKPNDFWRVIGVTNAGSLPENWTDAEYDDSGWPVRQSGFATSWGPYPGHAEQTGLPQNVPTYAFRKQFTVEDPEAVKTLGLRINYEHGFAAYLNGFEVARRSLPTNGTGRVPLGEPATAHLRGQTEVIDLTERGAALREGTNVLAIQLHSAGVEAPSMYMVAELVSNFARGPFVQNMTTNSAQVIWHTVSPTIGSVTYGKDASHLMVANDEALSGIHVVTLTNLEPNQTYIYQVAAQSDGGPVAEAGWSSFRTLKMPGTPISFLVFGDSGQGTTAQFKIADQMETTGADLVLHLGDVIYFCFTAAQADARVFSVYHDQMRTTPFFFSMGNHDGYCGQNDYLQAFYLPTNSVTGTEHWYSFDHGDAHFVALATDTQGGQRYDFDSPQFKWLEADLAASQQRWKFIFFHHVVRSSSLHTYDDYLGNLTYDKYELQAYIGMLATKYGAQVIFNGHDHNYERFATYEGYNSIVSGGGGASLYGQAIQEEGSVHYHFRHNFLKVTVNGEEMTLEAVDDNGVVFDRFYRSETNSGRGPIPMSWGTPIIEDAMGSDVAGNIPGQTFEPTTRPIRTRAGKRANLGHVHVRNDRNFLYVGFESATIWRNQAIALFIENPNQPGVIDLASLGNGVIDDENGEGVDGLDLLTKLGFTNFRPSVACVLGDERVDHTMREFQRLHMRWPIGQGVFRLDQGFSSAPGARLQQFDRSPQTAVPAYYNSNADFIEVAIPLSELGNPSLSSNPGNLKLGAIVFGDPGVGEMGPEIDTAFLGTGLVGGESGTFSLEPVTIQLAPDPEPDYFRATLASENTLRFEWGSVAGAIYRLESVRALGEAFQNVNAAGLPITATGAQTMFDLPIDGSSPQFYRLRAN